MAGHLRIQLAGAAGHVSPGELPRPPIDLTPEDSRGRWREAMKRRRRSHHLWRPLTLSRTAAAHATLSLSLMSTFRLTASRALAVSRPSTSAESPPASFLLPLQLRVLGVNDRKEAELSAGWSAAATSSGRFLRAGGRCRRAEGAGRAVTRPVEASRPEGEVSVVDIDESDAKHIWSTVLSFHLNLPMTFADVDFGKRVCGKSNDLSCFEVHLFHCLHFSAISSCPCRRLCSSQCTKFLITCNNDHLLLSKSWYQLCTGFDRNGVLSTPGRKHWLFAESMHVLRPEPHPPCPSMRSHIIGYHSTTYSATSTRKDYPWLTEPSLPFQRQEGRLALSSPPARTTTADTDDEK